MTARGLDWSGLGAELAAFEQHLQAGAATLQNAGNPVPGGTPRDEVFRHGKARLYRYRPLVNEVQAVPTLLVYALVNRASMADLEPARSLVRSLLDEGVDLHLIEWDSPTAVDAGRGLDAYLNVDLAACVQALPGPVNLMGICQGGTFALCYAALYPHQVRNLVTTVTPVDFRTPEDVLSHLLNHVDVDLFSARNMSGELLNALFLSLKPFRLMHQKYVNLVPQLANPDALSTFLRMEEWIFDSPDLAARALYEFALWFYRENRLVNGGLEIGGRAVALSRVTMPVLNIFAREDHLVPPAASRALGGLTGSKDYTELEVPGGHIGIYVGGKSRQLVAETIGRWLRQRT